MADTFLQTYAPLANDIAARTGLDATVVLGLIDTETGRGQHVVGSNIYGISPGGRVARYPNVETATEAFINLINSPRYASVAAARDPAAQAAALVRSGYNTVNPNYASLVGGKAQAFGKTLGYQDAAPAQTTAVPAAPAGPAATTQAAPASSPKERALAEVGGGDTVAPTAPAAQAAAPAAPQSAKERALAEVDSSQQDPTFTGAKTAVPAAPPQEPSPGPKGPIDWTSIGPEGVVGSGTGPPATTVIPTSHEDIRNALEPAEGTTYGEVLPFAKDDKTGEIRLALPEGIRGFARGLYALTQGPATGGMTPEATNALAGVMMGGRPFRSPAAGTGATIGGRTLPPGSAALGRTETPDLLGPQFRAAPTVSDNALYPTATGASEPIPFMQPPGPVEKLLGGTRYANPPPRERPPAPAHAPTPAVGADDAGWVSSLPDRIAEMKRENAEAHAQDLGAAATPEEQARISARDAKTARRVAEIDAVHAAPEPGDTTEWVKGSVPTRAAVAGNPKVSQAEEVIRQANPEPYAIRAKANNEKRIAAFDEQAGSWGERDSFSDRQKAQADKDEAAMLAKAKPGQWLQDTSKYLDEQLADPKIQKQPRVRGVLEELRAQLHDADGNLETDPRAVWGLHNHLRDELELAKTTTTAQRAARGQITRAKALVDEAMNKATEGGFATYNENWAKYAKEQNRIELLQTFREKGMLKKDRSGSIDANAFHRFVLDLAIKRAKARLDPAQDIPDVTMQRLIHINNDLKRDSNIDLGKARGSPTHLYGEVARALGVAGGHVLGGAVELAAGGTGLVSVVARGATERLGNMASRFRANQLTRRHLAEPKGGMKPNPLNQPD